jgi:hypothetical protein
MRPVVSRVTPLPMRSVRDGNASGRLSLHSLSTLRTLKGQTGLVAIVEAKPKSREQV